MDQFLQVYTAYSNLFNAITGIGMGCFVLCLNIRSRTVWSFALFCFAVSAWALPYHYLFVADNHTSALRSARLLHIGSLTIPPIFMNFTLAFLELRRRKLQIVNWAIYIAMVPFSFSPMYVSNVGPKMSYPFWPDPGVLYHLFVIYFFVNISYAHILMYKSLQISTGTRRAQIRLVFIGTMAAFTGGTLNFPLVYNIPIPPVLNIIISFYVMTVTYAIVRYRFMGIQLTSAEKDRLRSMLAVTGSINHEIRNPLSFILQDSTRSLAVIDDLPASSAKEELNECLMQIRKNVTRIIDVTRTMSQYAKPVKALTASESVDLGLICSEAVAEFKDKSAPDGRIQVDFELPRNTFFAYGDKVFIKESIRNFLDNAVFAIDKGQPTEGIIRVSVYAEDSKWVGLSISDNGCGIAADELERVFDLGFTRRQSDGFKHGAGLFLVKWYADQMKAKLNIESKLGEGTTVYMGFRRAKG